MPRKNQEQPDVPPFEYRAGVTIPALGGMYRRGDPSQVPVHRLHLGVNIRLADGEMGSRPGLTLVEGTTEAACIMGIFEIEDFSVGVYINGLGVDTVVGGAPSPYNVVGFNEEKVPVWQNYWDEGTLTKKQPSPWRITNPPAETPIGAPGDAFNTFQPFNDTLLIVNGLDVYQAEFSEDNAAPRMDLTLLFSLASGNAIKSTCVRRERVDDPQTGDEFDKDVLYMGCEGGKIWRYDGTIFELVKTLASGGSMQIITWNGTGLVAAGDSAAGFTYQEQPGFAWVDQAWGQAFNCNGLCEFVGEVVFVGDAYAAGFFSGYALHWDGSGAPTLFASDLAGGAFGHRYRTPVVAGGALHWLHARGENGTPDVRIARWTDFSTGSNNWLDIGQTGDARDVIGFFIPFAGAMLFLQNRPDIAAPWVEGYSIVLVFSGSSPTYDIVYTWTLAAAELEGNGYEAIPI
jgi:hypothetical protein